MTYGARPLQRQVLAAWRDTDTLKPVNARALALFGSSLAFGKDTLWVGAGWDGASAAASGGAVYRFER
ncbi:MAG TPA: hypothetical protein VNO21_14595 [Polyangiaceae bacterium]|nr:hypothetical protein [Polyangiaceae bacterium]